VGLPVWVYCFIHSANSGVVVGESTTFGYRWDMPPNLVEQPPYLVVLYIYIYIYIYILTIQLPTLLGGFSAATWQPMTGPRGDLSLGHITTFTSTWPRDLFFIISPRHLLGGFTECHVVIRTATWHFSIGRWTDQKSPKMSDMWQPLVLPRHHANTCHPLHAPHTLYGC
jgi:hypothetical protein